MWQVQEDSKACEMNCIPHGFRATRSNSGNSILLFYTRCVEEDEFMGGSSTGMPSPYTEIARNGPEVPLSRTPVLLGRNGIEICGGITDAATNILVAIRGDIAD